MKTTVKKVSSVLIAIVLLLSVASTMTANAFRGSDALYDYEVDDSYFNDLTIIDVAYWHDEEFDLIMPLSALSLGVTGRATSSTSVYLEGTLLNPDGEFITFRGFWLRRDGCDEVIQVAAERIHGIGGGSFSAPVGNLQAGATYNIRAVARIPGMEASARQSSAMRITLPGAQTATPPPGNTPTPTPGGGTTPTPTPGGGTTPTPTPGGGTTPTPTPTTPTPTPGPTLSFSNPSTAAPWNSTTWTTSATQSTNSATVNSYQRWSWTQCSGSTSWLTISGSGEPGARMTLSVQANEGSSRQATVTVTSGSLTRTLNITQSAPVVDIRGTRVIAGLGREGYVDINTATTTTILNASRGGAERPVWYFVHIVDNVFAIRNDTTGRYFTETGGGLRHESRISGTGTNYNTRQQWRLIPQANGSFRIRSVSNNMYVEDGSLSVTLANRDNSNWQQWRIGYIWQVARSYDNHPELGNWVAFWPGRINIWVEPLVNAGASDFHSAVSTARSTWEAALGIPSLFNNVTSPATANIRVYWGTPEQFQDEARLIYTPDERYGATALTPEREGISDGRVRETTIHAGGATRSVYRLVGTGDLAMIVGVWSHRGTRGINLAPFTATHELGHALGYIGHSPNSSDVMRAAVERWQTPDPNIRPAELEHIRQIYRRFRR